MFKMSFNNKKARNFTIFVGCVLFWLLFDRFTKIYFDLNYETGDIAVRNIGGLLRFELVHNTGAAWGAFSGSTVILAVVAIFVCIVVGVFAWKESSRANCAEIIGLSLIVSGGIGNCIDRLAYGHVVDFITPLFIDFPTFNIADIGVTCGIILAFVGYLVGLRTYDSSKGD